MRVRVRLSVLLWLVALVAVFLAGVRYGQYLEAARRPHYTTFKLVAPPPPGPTP